MKSSFFLFALSFWAFFGEPHIALATDYGTKLFEIFNATLQPQEITMVLSSQPRENGRIPMMYLDVKKARVAGMTVKSAQITGYEMTATPPAQWSEVPYPRIQSMLNCNVTAQVTQEDIDAYMKGRSFSGGRWHNVKVTLREGYFEASARYLADLKLFKTMVSLSMKGQLEVRQGTQLWLKVLDFQVNSATLPLWVVDQALQKVQPLLDLEHFVIPAQLAYIEMTPQDVVFSTRRPPQPLEGLSWHSKRQELQP